MALLISAICAFFAKKEYRAMVTFLPSSEGSSGALSLMGISLPSLSSGSILNDQIGIVFKSNEIKRKIIEKFNFYSFFKLTKSKAKYELASKLLKKYVMFETTEKGSMGLEKTIAYTITCYHPSADSAKLLCDYAFSLLDSSIKSISMFRAHRNRVFIEEQFASHNRKLDSIQEAFGNFQIANKAFIVPEQIKLSLKNYAEIKAAAILNELKMKSLQKEFHGPIPELDEMEKNESVYNQKLDQIESSPLPEVLPSLGLGAKLLPEYSNLMREIEVEEQVILLFSKELETSRIEEVRNVSPLVIVDPSYLPEYKARPKRIMLVGIFLVLEHFFLFLLFAYQFYFSNVLMKREKVREFFSEMKRS